MGLSFISNRQMRKEGMFGASELAGIEATPSRFGRAGYARFNLSAMGAQYIQMHTNTYILHSKNIHLHISGPSKRFHSTAGTLHKNASPLARQLVSLSVHQMIGPGPGLPPALETGSLWQSDPD